MLGSVLVLEWTKPHTLTWKESLKEDAGGLACALLGTVAGHVPLKNAHVPVYTEKCQERRGQAFKTFQERS